MSLSDVFLIILLIIPFIILAILWIIEIKRFIQAAPKYAGDNYVERKYVLAPNKSIDISLNGNCVIIVQGSYGWVTLVRSSGIKQRIFRLKLLHVNNESIKILNDSKIFKVIIIVRCENISSK